MTTLKTVLIIFTVLTFTTIWGQNNKTLRKTFRLIDKKENFIKALDILNDFIAKDTTNAEAYWQRAKCLRRKGDYEKAFVDIQNSIRLDSNNAEAFTELGTIYAMTKKIDFALESYNKSIAIDQQYFPAFNNRGALYYFFLNDNENALADYNNAIKLNPKDDNAYYNRGIIYRLKGQNEKAIIDLTFSLKFKPKIKMCKIFYERALCYENLKQYKKAIEDYEKAIKYNTIDPFEQLDNEEIRMRIIICKAFLKVI